MRMRVAAKNSESKARVSQFLSFSQEQVPNLRARDCLARIIALRLRGTITNCSLGIASSVRLNTLSHEMLELPASSCDPRFYSATWHPQESRRFTNAQTIDRSELNGSEQTRREPLREMCKSLHKFGSST